MKILSLIFTLGYFLTASSGANALPPTPTATGEYTIIIEGYDWGPAISRVVLALDTMTTAADHQAYSVLVTRQTDCGELPDDQTSGERRVVYAYVSDAQGNVTPEGKHVTLVMEVAPNNPLGSPIQYFRNEQCQGNNWIDYRMTITHEASGQRWSTETDRILPLVDRFDLSGKYQHSDSLTLSYASYVPESGSERPLIIWLHGGGEGGTDPSIPLVANRAANYASDDIQTLFGGAYVLAPQSPTYWMDNGQDSMTRGKENDVYNEALMALIQEYVAQHTNIDPNRIYVGCCSNGGYMTLKLLLQHPDYFAAAFPSALAYQSEYVTDEQIERIKNIPTWFVHSKDDSTTLAKNTVIPLYERLKAAGAENVHLSLYDHVVDITGFFGGDDYHYPGHWSWIYCHANESRRGMDGPVLLDGQPTTIMAWLAAQRKSDGKSFSTNK